MNLFTHLLIGLSVGFSILYANAYGAEDYPWLRKSLFTTGVIGAGVTLALSGGGLLFLRPILTLIQTPAELQGDCARYLIGIFAGLLFTGLYNLLAALLRAIGRTSVTLYALAAAMVCNIGLDLLLGGGAANGRHRRRPGHRALPGPVRPPLRRLPAPALSPATADP